MHGGARIMQPYCNSRRTERNICIPSMHGSAINLHKFVLHQQPVNGNSPKRIGCSHQPQRTASHKSDKDDVFLPDFSSFFMPWHPFQIFTTYILKLNIMHGADFYV
mmetsp:Transcript_43605/g.81614  ORF Transcript_43605/g.81614 Transcript_43605/m.81614 type:complete len:106 (+) Transcript_43605:204-521(+)